MRQINQKISEEFIMRRIVKSFRITPGTDQQLNDFCQKYQLTATEVINGALENYLAEENIEVNFDYELLSKEEMLELCGKLSDV